MNKKPERSAKFGVPVIGSAGWLSTCTGMCSLVRKTLASSSLTQMMASASSARATSAEVRASMSAAAYGLPSTLAFTTSRAENSASAIVDQPGAVEQVRSVANGVAHDRHLVGSTNDDDVIVSASFI